MNTTVIIPAHAASTRKDGSEFRRHFVLAFRSQDDVVTIDCSQAKQLGDDFADECFGMLTLDYSLATFYKHIHLLNATDQQLLTIATHIKKREQQRLSRLATIRQQTSAFRTPAPRLHFA